MEQPFNSVQLVCIWALPILFAVTLHEAAHGYVAFKLGDNTAHKAGRISLNPLKHIDLVGTIIIPIFLLITTSFVFGWAKPVPTDPRQLKNPKRDIAWVALAGPVSNLLMAFFWMGCLKLGLFLPHQKGHLGSALVYMAQAGVMINLVLAVLNIIPIPPLDGSRVVTSLLPAPWDRRYNLITPIGFLIVIALLISGILTKIMTPMVTGLQKLLFNLFGI